MKVRDVMTKDPITISPNHTVNQALEIIDNFGIWTLPVVSEGKIIGIVTKQDINLRSTDYNQKVSEIMSTPKFTISPNEDLRVAAKKLKRARINALLVVEGANLVGVITRFDINKRSAYKPKKTRISSMPELSSKNALICNIISVFLVVLLIFSIWLCYNSTSALSSDTDKLNILNNNIPNVQNDVDSLQAQINSNEHDLSASLSEIKLLESGKKYDLHNPTYSEVLTFLANDKTDQNKYDPVHYTCTYFSRDVCNNALKQGIRCAFVELTFPSSGTYSGHAIVAFNTTDKGLVYFEPQEDARAYVSIGEHYWQNVPTKPGYIRGAIDYDDTITEITCYW